MALASEFAEAEGDLVIERRTFLAVVSGLLAAPCPVGAQQSGKVYRIAFIASGSTPSTAVEQGPFFERLRELGWVYGRDVVALARADQVIE